MSTSTAKTVSRKNSNTIKWYRVPLPSGAMKELSQKSDWQGLKFAGGHTLLLILVLALGTYAQLTERWIMMSICILLYGAMSWFMISGHHELSHKTVFKTKWLNVFFAHVSDFFCLSNHKYFWLSHRAHHQYTLHQPDDLEIIAPQIDARGHHFLTKGIINLNPMETIRMLKYHWELITGRYQKDDIWRKKLMEEAKDSERRKVIQWSYILVGLYAAILVIGIMTGAWALPLMVIGARQFGLAPAAACGAPQHVGLQDSVPDFRLCCRTIRLNPILQYFYWNMNFHIEHHMYASVPCYHLPKLHKLVKHELPHTEGLVEAWKNMLDAIQKQLEDPSYRIIQQVPNPETLPEEFRQKPVVAAAS